ncbi:MAG: hypothetical protein M3N93_10375 [Acidobacteriota bacterium]|nr:hypothetical protein [Acidobacteriota bacterium]
MTAFQVADNIQNIGFLTYIRESSYTYPMIMATHLTSIAIFGGLILMTDLRLLGLAMTECSVTDVVKQLRRWKQIGFAIMVTMGLLLGTSEADKYYNNPYFLLKMFLLLMVGAHALVFHRSVYGNTEAIDRAPRVPRIAKTAAVLSLLLWIGIVSAGRWIAYYEQPKEGRKTVAAASGDTIGNKP